MRLVSLGLAAAVAGWPLSVAADPVGLDFTGTSKDSSQMFMTGEADGVIQLNSVWDPVGADGGPLAGIKGPCFGAMRLAGGMMTGSGYCAYTDPDGDTFFVRWWMENTATPSGAWVAAGGTGKWAKATGGGQFQDEQGADMSAGKTHITGTIDMHM